MVVDDLPIRISQKIEVVTESGCWIWTGRQNNGYGRISWKDRDRLAHRVVWTLAGRELPALPYVLDHICRVRCCLNPSHLRVLHGSTNVLIGESFSAENKRKTQCQKGHDFDTYNTYYDRSGKRLCRKCRAENTARWQARRKAMMVTAQSGGK